MNLARSMSAGPSSWVPAPREICLPPAAAGSKPPSGFEGRDCVVSGWGSSAPLRPLHTG
ncbi:unnamed protein product [Ixodes pacificus]